MDNTKDTLEIVVAAFTIIGGLVAAIIYISKQSKSLAVKKSGLFTGNWSNEGMIGEKSPSHYIDLTLSCSGNEVIGYFNVRKKEEEQTWHSVNITGKRFFSKAKCTIIHAKQGQVLNYGTVILKPASKGALKWILKNGIDDFFPFEAILYRSLPILA